MPYARRDEIGLRLKSTHVGPSELKLASVVVGALERALACSTRRPSAPTARYAGRSDAAVLQLALGVLAEVAGGRDDDDALVDDALGRERQRVGPVRLGDAARRPTG